MSDFAGGCHYCKSPAYFLERHGHKADCEWLALQRSIATHPSRSRTDVLAELNDLDRVRHIREFGRYQCPFPGCHYHEADRDDFEWVR